MFLPLLVKALPPCALTDLCVQVIPIFQAVNSTLPGPLLLPQSNAVELVPLPLLILLCEVIYDLEWSPKEHLVVLYNPV